MIKIDDELQEQETDEEQEKQENHMAMGLTFGLLAGAVAMSVLSVLGHIVWGGVCMGAGALLGLAIGAAIPGK